MRPTCLLLLAAIAAPASAQLSVSIETPRASASPFSPTADARAHWRTLSGYVIQVAMDVPEDKYSFKPTPEVRSFGELFAHVAGAESMFCAIALGEQPPAEDAVSATTKAGLVDALRQSAKNCERAYAQSDAAVATNVHVFGAQRSRLYALIMNATHDGEHYGNLVTYMRMNGMVPPSSRPSR
jgi:uncharacterized damage-inducible protein DinB